jgi:sensor histidine kinase regulating citrate/malate metabolism
MNSTSERMELEVLRVKIVNSKITITFSKNFVMAARVYGTGAKEGNSGIGLYMSKMIIEKDMGGQLSVENVEKGAVFKIIF